MVQSKEGLQRFQNALRARSLRFTSERRRIYQEVVSLKEHFNADSLYEGLRKKGARIARGTVYRTLPLLLESGVILKAAGTTKRDFYEKADRKGHHDHMVCLRCGRIIEFYSKASETAQKTTCKRAGFALVYHEHRLFGYCKKCQ